jgi:hypothetical protein
MQLLGDLTRGAAVLKESQHLGLTRLERRVCGERLLDLVAELAEDADHVASLQEGHGAHLDGHAFAVPVEEHDLGVRHRGCSGDLPREHLAGAAPCLRRADGAELTAANVADDLQRGRVDPTNHPRRVDHVARDVHVFERRFDVAADRAQP